MFDYTVYDNLDISDPEAVLSAIKELLSIEGLYTEQYLYGITYIMDKNTSDFIRFLKKELNVTERKYNKLLSKHFDNLESLVNSIKSDTLKTTENETKKKVKIVVKKHSKGGSK